MLKFFKQTTRKIGQPPGTVEHIGEQLVDAPIIDMVEYTPAALQERVVTDIDASVAGRDATAIRWINICGLHDVQLINRLGSQFSLHPLVLEDIVHTGQRPKLEDHEQYLYLVLRMLRYDPTRGEVLAEQVSFVLCQGCVISLQEAQGDVFESVRQRLRAGRGRIRRMGVDYLLYALLDAVVDAYFLVLEAMAERIEQLQEAMLEGPTPDLIHDIHRVRNELLFLRKAVWPLRDVMSQLERSEPSLLTEQTALYYRDVYDHVVQVIDMVETCRDLAASLQDSYLASVSNRMNEVMKVLTIIATIFIPLSFIAGVYGMNFEHMPELHWQWAYPSIWVVLGTVAGGMLLYFKRKRWL